MADRLQSAARTSGAFGSRVVEEKAMPFNSPPPPDPDNRPWLDVLHLRPTDPDHCYLSESRWHKRLEEVKSKQPDRPNPKSNGKD